MKLTHSNTYVVLNREGELIDISDCVIVSIPRNLQFTFFNAWGNESRAGHAIDFGVPLADYLDATFPEPNREGKAGPSVRE